jgi:hypothetical protein
LRGVAVLKAIAVSFVALASCVTLPEPDEDEELLVRALADEGIDARVLPWDGDAAAFIGASRIVLRSTWQYYLAVDTFLAWASAHADRLDNPATIVRWNAHKGYLRDLEAEGLPVVPTAWIPKGTACDLDSLAASRGWNDVVVKPAVSAGSYSTRRMQGPPFEVAFACEVARKGDVMVQPYLASVDDYGERSIICIDGVITHAVRKSPRFAGQAEHVSDEAVPLAEDERALAQRVLARFAEPLLYARIDTMRDAAEKPRISEVELIEPSLFLRRSPLALRRLASAIARRSRGG